MRRVAAAMLVVIAACAERAAEIDFDRPSALDPAGPAARSQASAGWFLIWTATAVSLLFLGMLGYAIARRRRPGPDDRVERRIMIGLGLIMTSAILAATMAVVVGTDRSLARLNDSGLLDVEVVAYQYWWEVRYPGTGAVTANEIHIPAGVPVRFVLRSADVIHSLWVPQLGGKMDMIPGRTTETVLQADRPGVYRGQCAEFCSVQHAKMAFVVIAEEPREFRDWLDREARDAQMPTDATALRGRELFLGSSCAGCHAIRGTDANGEIGPDLTHLAARMTIAAAVLANDEENLRDFVADAQRFKQGANMPPIPLGPDELRALVAFLQSLR